jgi:hypothetical protein
VGAFPVVPAVVGKHLEDDMSSELVVCHHILDGTSTWEESES